MTIPHYISEAKSDMRGFKPGWYVMDDDRNLVSGPFSSREECVEKNTSYCQHWISELKVDPKLIVKAAGKAQRAVDRILGRQWDQSSEHSEPSVALAA